MNPIQHPSPYGLAQAAMAQLKEAVYLVVAQAADAGLSNSTVGRSLGIYGGHVGHEGHISRTVLAMLESEGVVEQDKQTKLWRLKKVDSD